ncbi:MAG: hypothetical protein QM763_01930 [Agriterribacter sp.]
MNIRYCHWVFNIALLFIGILSACTFSAKQNFISIKDRESFWRRLRGTIRGNMDTTAYR